MLDMKGILKDYRLLKFNEIGEVCDTHEKYGEYTTYLIYTNFTWEPPSQAGYTPQLYLGDEPIHFKAEKKTEYKDDLRKKLNSKKLRMPKISKCRGRSGSIMFNDELLTSLEFSPILGITKTTATITDAIDDVHEGYTALSFHKALSYTRCESRLKEIPVEQRPIICIALTTFERAFVVHTSVLEKWKALGVKEVQYDFDDKDLELKKVIKKNRYSFASQIHYLKSIEAYQNNDF